MHRWVVIFFFSETFPVRQLWVKKMQIYFNLLIPQRTVPSYFKIFLLIVYGLADGHKPLHKLRLHNAIFFNTLKLEKIWNMLVRRFCSAVSLMYNSVNAVVHSVGNSLRDITYAWVIHSVCLWAYIRQVPTLIGNLKPDLIFTFRHNTSIVL